MERDIEGPDEDPPGGASGSLQPGERDRKPPAGAAATVRKRSTCRAYAEESWEERTWRSRGAAAEMWG